MTETKDYIAGIILTILVALTAKAVSTYIPMHLISASVFCTVTGDVIESDY